MKNKTQLSIVNLSTYTSPQVKEKAGTDWIEFGSDNNYFQYLIDRYNGSPTNMAIINGISEMIYGKGLDATDSHRRPEQYAMMISLFKDQVVRRLCSDLKLMGQCAIQVIYSKDRSRIVKLEHIPVETLRAEKCNDKGEVPAYFYFNDWSKYKRSSKLTRIPAFGMSNEGLEILYVKPYRSGYKYYSPPDYEGGTQYAELEQEISNYHLNNILNGLAPSMLINMNNGTPSPAERELIEQRIYQKFSGTSNAGKFILSFNDDPSTAATIEPIQLSDAHNQYQFLSDESSKKIMVAHRVVSPMLLGVKDNTGFGSNADELKTASILMDNMVIRPFQTLLINAFDQILAYNDISLHLYFKTLQPLEFTDLSNVTDAETREEETGVKLKKSDDNCELSDDNIDTIIGSLEKTGVKMSDEWVLVDELDEDSEYSNEDWANYLIKPKTNLSNNERVELISSTDYNVGSEKNGNAYSVLDSLNGLYKIRYKYARGMSRSGTSRPFCQKMMNLSRLGIVWRIEDIDKASWDENVNVSFRHLPQMKYNIFTLKGGIYCQHKWVRVLYRLESNTEPSNNLKNYKKTKTIPAKYNRNPRGSKKAATATGRQKGKGKFPI